MKKIILIIIAIFSFCFSNSFGNQKVDVTVKPDRVQSNEFNFPKYATKSLKNGFKYFTVEDNEQPVISMTIIIPGGSSVDEKPGIAEFTARLLTKGAGNKDALEIAQTLDGIGASINATATSDYIYINADCLKKHLPVVMNILSDIVLRPEFSKNEFKKLIPMKISEIQQSKSDPHTLANDLARIVSYGKDHPYSLRSTEESVKSIELSDIKKYYQTYFKPNNATISIVGDFQTDEIVKELEKYFGSWKKEAFPAIKLPDTKPMPLGVYFVERPGSVQSSVLLTTRTVPYSSPDYESVEMASNVVAGGFAGRLFANLREKHSYTYTPFGYQTSSKFFNRFACGADVGNIVTDSAIMVIKEQMKDLGTVVPSETEINRVKIFSVGSYLMNYEETDFIAGLIQKADFYGIPLKKVESYPARMMVFTPFEIKKAASKYLNPENAYIVVIGSPEVKSKLEKFGQIFTYNLDLQPQSGEGAKLEKTSISVEKLIEKMTDAIGGKNVISGINTIIGEGNGSIVLMGQQMEGKITDMFKTPNKRFLNFNFGAIQQSLWCDGINAWMMAQNTVEKLEGDFLKQQIIEATILSNYKLIELGFSCEVLGKENNNILLKAVSPTKKEKVYYIDANSYLINKIDTKEESLQGPIILTEKLSNYQPFGSILLPTEVENFSPVYTSSITYTYKINENILDSEFLPYSKDPE